MNTVKFNKDKKTYKAKYEERILRNQEFSPKKWHVMFCIYTIMTLPWWWLSPNIRCWS